MTDHWDRYFLQLALDTARMSKDPATQVGAVIVDPYNHVISTGFNGFPSKIKDTPDRLNNRDVKLQLMVHAEMNAVLSAARRGVPLTECSLYFCATDESGEVWGGPPCTRCLVEIAQTGITELVSPPQKKETKWLKDLVFAAGLLGELGVSYREVLVRRIA